MPTTALPVAVLAPVADAVSAALDAPVLTVADEAQLADAVHRDDIGAVVLTAASLAAPGVAAVLAPLGAVPLVVLAEPGEVPDAQPGVAVLEGPVAPQTVCAAVRLARWGRRHARRALRAERADDGRALARELVRSDTHDRERAAQTIHEDLQQVLVGLRMHVSLLDADAARSDVRDHLAGLVDRAIEQARQLTADLAPPTLVGDDLGSALRWVADAATTRHGLSVEVDIDVSGPAAPSADARAVFARAARELLSNVAQHAGVDRAWVRAWCTDDACRMEVCDRGSGSDGAAEGHGLADLRRRVELVGGNVVVRAVEGGGTAVEVALPADA